MKKARIRYEENFDGKEGYVVEILSDGEYGLDTFFPLWCREGGEEKDFIHWSIFAKIKQLIDIGYKVEFK